MKEGFDLSHYLNVGKGNQEKQSEQSQPSEPAKLSSTSEQTLPSQPLNEAKEAEHSEQEKRQATPSIQRRISQKQRKENLDSYRESFLVPHKIIDRKATYLSRSTWERLEFVVRQLGDYGANVSSFLECIALRHLEEYSEDIEHWRKL